MILNVVLLLACESKPVAVKPVEPPTPGAASQTEPPPPIAATPTALALPPALAGKAEVVPPTDPAYAPANVAGAVKPAGDGGISEALVVKITADIPVNRMWSGPAKLDSNGNTNRLGRWWSYDAPPGTQAQYRTE